MATLVKKFSFASNAENWQWSRLSTSVTMEYDSAVGNPAGSLKLRQAAKNHTSGGTWYWEGTWEDLGVPAGAKVTHIRLNSADYRCTEYNVVANYNHGPWLLQNGSGSLLATLAALVDITATHASWQNRSGSDQAVPSSHEDSNSIIRLAVQMDGRTGANNAAAITLYNDEIEYVISYEALAPTVDGTTSGSAVATGLADGIVMEPAPIVDGTALGSGKATSFVDAEVLGFTGTIIEKAVGGGSWEELVRLGSEATSYKDGGPFTQGITYSYRVKQCYDGVDQGAPTLVGSEALLDTPSAIQLSWSGSGAVGWSNEVSIEYQDPDRVFIERAIMGIVGGGE